MTAPDPRLDAPVAFHKLSRQQLLMLAIALQDQRDKALSVVEAQAGQIATVRELHVPILENGEPVGCELCDWEHPAGDIWPCETIAALAPEGPEA